MSRTTARSETAPAIATIDVGTNTTLLLIARRRFVADGGAAADAHEPAEEPVLVEVSVEVLADEAEITRLGRGIGDDRRLRPDAIERTLAALRRYAALAKQHHGRIAAVGTEALRRASNAEAFLRPAAEILGVPIEVIDGEREAELTFAAVAASFPADVAARPTVVVDIGGGSTEIVIARQGHVESRISLPIGSVRLTEQWVRSDPPAPDQLDAVARAIDAALDAMPALAQSAGATEPSLLVGVAGTVTSLAAMALGLATYDPARVHGSSLSAGDLAVQIERLRTATQAEREQMIGLDPRRADVILAGALILSAIVKRLGNVPVRVSDRGIRWGLFFQLQS
jgi:exopolyphosphatase/guanosine-5'-triphosphate,3'-diphosphate pyrophosphatase